MIFNAIDGSYIEPKVTNETLMSIMKNEDYMPPINGDVRGSNGYPSNVNFEFSSRLEVITINALDGSVVDGGLG